MPQSSRSWLENAAEIGHRSIAVDHLDAVLIQAVEAITVNLEVEFSSFLELLPDGRALLEVGHGWSEELVGDSALDMSSDDAAGCVIRSQKPLVVADWHTDDRFQISTLLSGHGVVSSLLVPVYGPSRPLGVLSAHSKRLRQFMPDEIAWLQIVANSLSVGLERKWSAQREQNQKLLRAEQMMAIGQVAAGVAHELRNPLTSIKGLIQVNLRELQERGLPVEDLAVIEHEIRRMERTLQTFLDFARPPKPDRRPLDLTEIVDRVFALVGGRARKQDVSLKFVRPETRVIADVDQDQIQQLLLNLVLNALDAMPHGGAIEVDLQATRDGAIVLSVRDTGPGIAPQIVPKVFETFVSSKETGVGLGLPLSRRIAEDHGGSLTAYNLPLAGACFRLRLPAIQSQAGQPDSSSPLR